MSIMGINVLSLLTTVSVPDFVIRYNELYSSDPADSITEGYYSNVFLPIIKAKVLINTPYCVHVDQVENRHDDPIDDTNEIEVTICQDGTLFAMSFAPWGEVLAMPFRCGFTDDLVDIAVHVFWELTWHGLETDMEERRDEVMDRIEEVERILDAHKQEGGEPDEVPRGLTTLDDFLEKWYDGETPEQKAERKAQSDTRIANYRTARRFRNGKEET